MRRLIIAGICSIGLFLLPSCGKEDNETMPVSDEGLLSGPPPSQSEGTFVLSARGGKGSKTSGGDGGGIDVTPKADPKNVGDGSMSNPTVSSSVLSQVFTVECQKAGGFGEAEFSVVGSVSGPIGTALSDEEFVDAENRVRFTITTGFTTPWAVGDKFTFEGPPLVKFNGANVQLIKSGSVDTGFTVPFEPEDLGSNPRTISTGTTINLEDQTFSCPTPPPMAPIPGDNPNQDATGLKVLAGATLMLVPDPDCGDVVYLSFIKDVIVEGTLTTTVTTAPNRADLSLTTNRNLIVRPGGNITMKGDSNSSGSGDNGGDIAITTSNGKVVLEGTLDSSGGDGTAGGDGGSVSITAESDLYSTGAVTTNGGVASAGNGGNAGSISLTSNANSSMCFFNSGNLSANGGDGTTGGGNGGNISLDAGDCGLGDLINAGTLSASGGTTTATGNGGDGGALSLTANGSLLNTGPLSTNGGGGVETAPVGVTSAGGDGGVILMTLTSPTEGDSVQIAASISANGGNGTIGGSGSASITIDAGDGDLHLLNFNSFDLAGGDGKTQGGEGGRLTMSSDETLFNELAITVSGGKGTGVSGVGGPGGPVILSSDGFLINYGAVTVNGGDGDNEGGSGGSVTLASAAGDLGKVLNTANLSANGGLGSDITKGAGGTGGEILIIGEKLAANQGILSANGGDATKTGGDGGRIEIQAFSQTINSQTLQANGGNAVVENPDVPDWTSNGGDGGVIVLATQAQPTTHSATLLVVKGTGSEDSVAIHGRIYIDGTNATPSDGILQP